MTSLTFFLDLGFFSVSSFSSLISTFSSSSFFSASSSFLSLSSSSSSSSEISLSVVFSTYNWMGNWMNSECFLIKSFNLFSSRNSTLSDFMCKTILVPLVNSESSCSAIEKVPPAEDSHK